MFLRIGRLKGEWRSVRRVFLRVEETPNPMSRKYVPDEEDGLRARGVGEGEFSNARDGMKNRLARRLFRIEGVRSVFIARDFFSVNKEDDVVWDELSPFIYETFSEFADESPDDDADATPADDSLIIKDDDTEVVKMIKELLDSRIRPAVQEDGGDIQFLNFDETNGIVYVLLQGSCSGCPSSSVTLKNGIERMLMHWIAEVNSVIGVDNPSDLEILNQQVFNQFESKKADN